MNSKNIVLIAAIFFSYVLNMAQASDTPEEEKFLLTVEAFTGEIYGEDNFDFYAQVDEDGDFLGLSVRQNEGTSINYNLEQLKSGIYFLKTDPQRAELAMVNYQHITQGAHLLNQFAKDEGMNNEQFCVKMVEVFSRFDTQTTLDNSSCLSLVATVDKPGLVSMTEELIVMVEENSPESIPEALPVVLKLVIDEKEFKSGRRLTFELSNTSNSSSTQFFLQKFESRWIPYYVAAGAYIGYDGEKQIDEGSLVVVDIFSAIWYLKDGSVDRINTVSPLSQGHADIIGMGGGGEYSESPEAARYHDRHPLVRQEKARIFKENGFPRPY
ncbi:MAG: hypothetical protein HOE90_03950 [Bacteriovoracaceae bacterium]|jgi:hypothetical protein|nr:hypothetical protein [Bacteriovoracaceae bacterium]